VIGKGKLIANTSIKKLVSSNSKSSVFIRSPEINKLQKLLETKSFIVRPVDKGLEITGANTDEIGKLVFGANLPLLELTNRQASLEEVFLELTENTEEFKAQNKEINQP
jgi:ABC-2 type transport system ATP-binding protein